jgi:hypothetical protein
MGSAKKWRKCRGDDRKSAERTRAGYCTYFPCVCQSIMTNAQQAPPSFNFTPPASATNPSRPAPATAAAKPSQPDLITRYNLASKLSQTSESGAEEQPKAKAWSADRNERQMNLQRRREEMILAARRKLEQQEKGKAPAT